MERLLILPQMDLLDHNLIISDLKKEDSFPQIVPDDGGKFSPRLHGSYADRPFLPMRRGPPPDYLVTREWLHSIQEDPGFLIILGTLRNRTAGRLRTAEWRKNFAEDRECTVSRYIFSPFYRLPAFLLSKVTIQSLIPSGRRPVDLTLVLLHGLLDLVPWGVHPVHNAWWLMLTIGRP